MFAIIVKGDSKASFSKVTSPEGIGESATSFPRLLHFSLDPYLIMPNVKQGNKYHFLSLSYDLTWD